MRKLVVLRHCYDGCCSVGGGVAGRSAVFYSDAIGQDFIMAHTYLLVLLSYFFLPLNPHLFLGWLWNESAACRDINQYSPRALSQMKSVCCACLHYKRHNGIKHRGGKGASILWQLPTTRPDEWDRNEETYQWDSMYRVCSHLCLSVYSVCVCGWVLATMPTSTQT